jgi:psp operon transcriptional activator
LPTSLREATQDFEIDLLKQGLKQARFNQRKAAELLGLTYHQLRGLLKKYELLGEGASPVVTD